jgi:hypothetical protein
MGEPEPEQRRQAKQRLRRPRGAGIGPKLCPDRRADHENDCYAALPFGYHRDRRRPRATERTRTRRFREFREPESCVRDR